MTYLFILNDAPYVSERSYNALRLAISLAGNENNTVNLFLIGDGVWCAVADQAPPQAGYRIDQMLERFAAAARRIGACRTCLDRRDIRSEQLVAGTRRSSLEELACWTEEADKVLVF